MRTNAPLYGILAAVWILAGTWIFSKFICGSSVANSAIPALSVEDGLFKATAPETFYFNENAAAPNAESTELKESFAKIATYVNANSDKQLTLVGLYDKDEANPTEYENLGVARAESMKKLLNLVHGADESRILTSGASNDSLIYINNRLYNGVTFTFVEPTENFGQTVSMSDEMDMTPEDWTFSGNNIDLDVTPEIQHYLDKLRSYLSNNPGSVIEVNGHVAASGSASQDDRESLNRASKVRRLLRNNGFKSAEVVAIGNGSESPILDSDDPEAEDENNRVVITVRTK